MTSPESALKEIITGYDWCIANGATHPNRSQNVTMASVLSEAIEDGRAALNATAQSTLERLTVEKLAKHFAVSVEQAQAAQDDIGFMYRVLASAVTLTDGGGA